MPYLNFDVSKDLPQDLADQIAATLTDLTATLLGKKPEVTSVAIRKTDPARWYVGARSMAATGQTTFYLDIKITEGTNTKNEKAAYARQVFDALAALLGPLAPASYIVMHEVRADAWGYEGQTQEFRYIRGKPL